MTGPRPAIGDRVASGGLPDLALDARRVALVALEEDGSVDITTQLAGVGSRQVRAQVEIRTAGVVSGLGYALAVVEAVGGLRVEWQVREGGAVGTGAVLGELHGAAASMFRAERPMLNLLQRACGIATLTRTYVRAVAGTPCRILHTRKTAPGLRGLDVRAVLAGGGAPHRVTLESALLIKDNHWQAMRAGAVEPEAAVRAALDRGIPCFVEVESLTQAQRAARAGATRLLIDNQPPAIVREWKAAAVSMAPGIEIEASGGIDVDTVRAYAEAGADFVSIGALTHSVAAADVALEVTSVV